MTECKCALLRLLQCVASQWSLADAVPVSSLPWSLDGCDLSPVLVQAWWGDVPQVGEVSEFTWGMNRIGSEGIKNKLKNKTKNLLSHKLNKLDRGGV